jgi:hypothetical protein
MKQRFAILFMMLYGLALLRPALPLIDYYVKLNEYQQSCVNRSKPQLHCNGQCVLMKKLQALDAGNNAPAAPMPVKINFEDYPLGFIERVVLQSRIHNAYISQNEYIVSCLVSPGHLPDVFHPPLRSIRS